MENTLLNLIPSSYIPEVHLSQYDVGRSIPFKLMDGNSEYSVPSGANIKILATKPSGLGFEVACTFSGNIVTLVNTETMSNEAGRFRAELRITSGNVILGTSNFIMNVERSPHPEGTIDGDAETLLPELTLLVERIENSNARIESMTATAESLPEGSTPTADYNETTNVITFGIPAGEKGEKGDKGDTGAKGDKGDKGDTGEVSQTEFDALKSDLSLAVEESTSWDAVSLELEKGYYGNIGGEFNQDNSRRTAKIDVNVGEKYKLSTYTRPASISGLVFFNSNDAVISHFIDGTGTAVTTTDYEFTVPENAVKMAVQSADYEFPPLLKKQLITKEFVGYTKDEIDTMTSEFPKKYGVKWEIGNNDDLGARCFDAVGLSATIGIGATDGSSDFDSIYPWSEIKRCNISKNANGAEIVTFEGETDFALDGTNGDVFVRIPKFYYERYRENGYEYRVISAQGTNVHPVFIEDGKVLDEIFISAFEGFVDANDKMRSIGGVIPTGNKVPQEFLTSAQKNGDNYSLYDNRCVDAVWSLMAVEFGKRNTNNIFIYGIADYEQPNTYSVLTIIEASELTNSIKIPPMSNSLKRTMPVGSNITICDTQQTNVVAQRRITNIAHLTDYSVITFDGDPISVTTNCFVGSAACITNFCELAPAGNLNWHTGRANWIENSTTQNPVRYRWMENLFGNLWHFLPDITFSGLQMYVCENMKDYVMHKKTAPYNPQNKIYTAQSNNGDKSDNLNANYWITDLDNGEFTKGADFGRTFAKNLLSTNAFGAYYYLNNDDVIIANGGGFDHLYRCNMLTQRAWILNTARWFLYGARLMYKHIN